MTRYEVIASVRWQHDNGSTASIYGACPWTSESDKPHWKLVNVGWTVRDNVANTVGFGRPPYRTRKEAQAFADRLFSFGHSVMNRT